MKVFVVCAILIAGAFAAPSIHDNKVDDESTFSRAARFIGNCLESDDITTCLAVKGITAMNRAARSNNIEIVSGVSFTRDPNTSSRNGKALSETDIVANIESSEDRTGRLIDMAMQSAVEFFSTHNLNVKVPAETTQEIARSIEEGRGKLKKVAGPLVMAIGAKLITIIPLILGALALLTFKAIIVSKIALVLALFVGASKLFGGSKLGQGIGGYNANQYTGSNGWSSSGSASYPYARSLSEAQDMAYEKQVPAQ